jgi:hypothetical protein
MLAIPRIALPLSFTGLTFVFCSPMMQTAHPRWSRGSEWMHRTRGSPRSWAAPAAFAPARAAPARGVDVARSAVASRSPSILARLEALARAQAPLRRALTRVAGRVVATRSWERLGFARASDYARERAGLSGRQLQDLAHMDARLSALPAVEAAWLAGALSWSKARLLARVADAVDERLWVAFARGVPVRALEREVRAVDLGAVEAGELAGPDGGGGLFETDENGSSVYPKAGVIVRCSPDVQAKFHRARQLARRVAGEPLPTWACMEAVAAEVLSALGSGPEDEDGAESEHAEGAVWADRRRARLRSGGDSVGDREPRQDSGSDEATGTPTDKRAANVCAPEALPAVRLLAERVDEADAFELDARLRRAVALEQRIEAEMAPMLRRVADARLYRCAGRIRDGGYPSLAAYARDRLGMSERKARALVRLARVAGRCPELAAPFASGDLSWVQVHVLLPLLALPESAPVRASWLAWAGRVSVRRLEADIDAALQRLARDPEGFASGGGAPERQTCAQSTDPETPPAPATNGVETTRFFFIAPRDVAQLFRAVVCSVRRALEPHAQRSVSEGEAVGWMFDHAFESWGAGKRRVRREHRVFERDGWRCTVPGCSSYRNLHDHHVVFRSSGGSDELSNRTTLCAFHHLRGVHAGRVRCTGTAPHGLRFDLGLRDDRPPLLRYGAGDRLVTAATAMRA